MTTTVLTDELRAKVRYRLHLSNTPQAAAIAGCLQTELPQVSVGALKLDDDRYIALAKHFDLDR